MNKKSGTGSSRANASSTSLLLAEFARQPLNSSPFALDFSSKGSMHGRAGGAAVAPFSAAWMRFRARLGGGAGLSSSPEHGDDYGREDGK